MEQVIAWIISLLTSVAPLGRKQYTPEAIETVEEAKVRYESIAKDAIFVAYNPQEEPLFEGSRGRIRTVMVILAVSTFESSFRRDVDLGIGKLSKGDGGKSWCLNQINLGKADADGNTPNRIIVNMGESYKFTNNPDEGWGGADLVRDRKKCFHAALAIIRSSFSATRNLPLEDRLKVYASGSIEKGEEASRRRMGLAIRWMNTKVPKFRDPDVLDWMSTPLESREPEGTILISQLTQPFKYKPSLLYAYSPQETNQTDPQL